MVFVTVGNARCSFIRLLQAVDRLAEEGVFGSLPVFVQAGHTPEFEPRCVDSKYFISLEEFDQFLHTSDLVITHGGGTVMSVVQLGKIPIVMPRMKKYGEHVNDHQVQFVRALAEEGWLVPAYEPGELGDAIEQAKARNAGGISPPRSSMVSLVKKAVEEMVIRTP